MLAAAGAAVPRAAQDDPQPRRVSWSDIAPLHSRFEAAGITAGSFPAYVVRTQEENVRRMREGDLDHLVFYLLQSTRFTDAPPVEPALSAKALVDSLNPDERDRYLDAGQIAPSRIPRAVHARIAAFVRVLDSATTDARLTYFRSLLAATYPDAGGDARAAALGREYLRAMRFVYEKEFVAQKSAHAAAAVAELYRSRGLSTDTAAEAGYVVYLGLGVLKGLDPARRIRRVLIVGPGLDLAPRTGFTEAGPPESYQPWAVMDALLTLRLAQADDLEVVAADINPRVVSHLHRAGREPPVLTLVSGISETAGVTLSGEYREYFSGIGRSIGAGEPRMETDAAGRLRRTVRVRADTARALRAERLDIVTERLDGPPFDLVVATNILPYFDDPELMLALANAAAMLAPGGAFLHNEGRPLIGEVTAALGVPFEGSRHAVIAHVRGGPAPLFDSVWLHRRAKESAR